MDSNDQDKLNDSFNGEFPIHESSEASGMDSSGELESLQTKRRVNNPSPSAFMVAASPPKFVSFDQLMQAANGVTNMALAHEIAVDNEFKLEKFEAPSNSVEKQVKEIMHKAFWDILEEKLHEEPPDYSHALVLFAEVKETLMSLLLPQHQRLKSHIEEVLDLELIKQKAENEALDIMYYADFVISIMTRLCAPVRDEQVEKLREIKEVVPLFREVLTVLDLMKMDMANFTIQQIRPYVQQQSVEYERKKFQEFIVAQEELGVDGLELTKHWLNRNFHQLQRDADSTDGPSSSSCSKFSPAAVLNSAYLELLCWDENSQLFPETLVLDEGRFLDLRERMRRLSLISAILLLVYNTAGDGISGIKGFKDKLKKEITILLDGVPESEVKSKLTNVADHVIRQVDDCLEKHDCSMLTEDQKTSLKGQINDVVSQSHPVHKIINSRVRDFLSCLMASGCKSSMKLPQGLSAVETELSQVAGQFIRLVSHNRSVFGLYYADIIGTLLRRQSDVNQVES